MKEGTEHYDAVKAGYGGRARRGNSKPGGYDMTPTRRGPQKKKRQVVRIRYVEDERRKGGSLEQMIEVGRMSVHRQDRGGEEDEGWHGGGAATRSRLKEQGQRTC